MRMLLPILLLLFTGAPAIGSAQETPPTPRADSLRPTPPPRWQRAPRWQPPPRWQRAPRWQVPRARPAPRPPMVPLPGAALLSPRLRQELQLTDAQVQRLDALHDEARTQERARLDAWRTEQQRMLKEQREARAEALERMRAVLTAEQQQKLEQLRQQRVDQLRQRRPGAMQPRRPPRIR